MTPPATPGDKKPVSSPGLHPLPPPGLASVPLPLTTLDAAWYRHHQPQFDPIFFGRTGECRFDAPPPARAFGVLYLAADVQCAFIETFGHGHVDRGRLVTLEALARKRLAVVTFRRPLRLVDLTEAGLAQIGADARLCVGDYDVAQHWSGALHAHPDVPDGLLYRSRHDPGRLCAAVYDRAGDGVESRSAGTLADAGQATLLADILRTYRFGLR